MSDQLHLKITIVKQQTAIEVLSASCDLSKTELKRTMNCGAVWLKSLKHKRKRLRKAQYLLKPGDFLELFYNKQLIDRSTDDPTLLKNTSEYSLWYKPPFLLTQGTDYGDHLSLLRFAEKAFNMQNRLFLIHRLDREARGLVLLAHSKRCAGHISKQFQQRTIKKRYFAKVHGMLGPEGQTKEIDNDLDAKTARTVITPGSYSPENNETEVNIIITTGRMHQIRRHLSMTGFPIIGDRRYSNSTNTSVALKLCACELVFKDPATGTPVQYVLPDKFLSF